MKAVIGALRVNLGIDSAQFGKGLGNAESRLKKFGKAVKTGLKVAAAAVAAAGAAVGVAVRGMLNEMDKMTKMAQSIGVPVEELTRLSWAADLSGVSVESLSTSIGRLARSMQDAKDGLTTPQRAFDDLGISVENADGTLKSVSAVMQEMAGRFSQMEDGTQKTAQAMVLLGRSGSQLIPMLNQGADGMKRMMQEADELGIVIDKQTGQAAERFNDNLNRLSKVQKGIITQLTARMLPTLERFSQVMVGAAKNSEFLDNTASALNDTFRGLVSAGVIVTATFKAMIDGIRTSFTAISQLLDGQFRKAFDTVKDYSVDTFDSLGTSIETIKDLWKDAAPSNPEAVAQQISAPAEIAAQNVEESVNRMNGAVRRAHESQREFFARGRELFVQTRTPLEQYTEQIKELNDLLKGGAISQQTYLRAAMQAGDQLEATQTKLGESTEVNKIAFEGWMRSVSDGFADAILKGKSLGGVLKNLVKQLAKTELSNLIFGGLTGKSGEGSILAELGKNLKLPGFQQGGSFKVGGAGGIDSQVVAFRASPNERVDITRPDQQPQQMGGETVFNNIDARGATDPAAVEQAVMRAVPGIVNLSKSRTLAELRKPSHA